jgi:hypothetical protein
VEEANKVDKIKDHGYMDLGYLGFMNDVSVNKRVDAPTKADMGCVAREKEGHQG